MYYWFLLVDNQQSVINNVFPRSCCHVSYLFQIFVISMSEELCQVFQSAPTEHNTLCVSTAQLTRPDVVQRKIQENCSGLRVQFDSQKK